MQGHPESPCLWEKHADSILRELGLTPTVHGPWLYSGMINGKQVIFKRQVDDFAIAAPDATMADILLDMLDDKLTIPIKCQGFLDVYNVIDVHQTRNYIKIACASFVNKCCDKYIDTWMKTYMMSGTQPTPFSLVPTWIKKFNAATGDPDKKVQSKLAKEMKLSYRLGVGELIWAKTTCCPDLAYVAVKLSQSNHCPHEHHYHRLCHALKYLYVTNDDGIYFWRGTPNRNSKRVLSHLSTACED
jgi:hypothetical protein